MLAVYCKQDFSKPTCISPGGHVSALIILFKELREKCPLSRKSLLSKNPIYISNVRFLNSYWKTFSQAISSYPSSEALSGLSRAGQQEVTRMQQQGHRREEWQAFAIRWEQPFNILCILCRAIKKRANPTEKKHCAAAVHFCSIL